MSLSHRYIDWYNKKKKEIEAKLNTKSPFGDFFFTSLSLKKFLPEFQQSEHIDFIKKVKLHQSLASYDIYNLELLNNLSLPKRTIKNLQTSGNIIVTYHVASYRQLLLFFLKKDIPYQLVTDSRFIVEQGDEMQRIYKIAKQEWKINTESELKIINAEDPNSFFSFVRTLKKDINLVFYIDGNKSANRTSRDNLTRIKFFQHYFYARVGIGYLSYLTNKPIIPIINFRDKNLLPSLKVFDKIYPDGDRDKHVSANTITQKLYEILQKTIQDNAAQWEGWLYVHHFTDTDSLKEEIKPTKHTDVQNNTFYIFNEKKFGLIQLSSYNILFNKAELKSHKISDSFTNTLNLFKTKHKIENIIIDGKLIQKKALKELIEKEILTPNPNE